MEYREIAEPDMATFEGRREAVMAFCRQLHAEGRTVDMTAWVRWDRRRGYYTFAGCVGGWMARAPQFQAVGLRKSFWHGLPKYRGATGHVALARFLNFDHFTTSAIFGGDFATTALDVAAKIQRAIDVEAQAHGIVVHPLPRGRLLLTTV
jgi:hypothetical protein